MIRVSLIGAALMAATAGAAWAQEQVMPSLAEVARQAEAAKANARKAKKTYTNSSLSADPRGEAATTAAPAAVATVAKPVTAAASAPAGTPAPAVATAPIGGAKVEGELPKESEESWRTRAAAVRTQADRLRVRMAELTTPNGLRDQNPPVKAANDVEIANTRTAVDALKKQWARIEASANERKIPLAWIQPAPVFPQ